MRNILFIIYYLFLFSFITNAQVGKEFWFVAPDVTVDHGDEPIVFRITALDNNAKVTISMPANGGQVISKIKINANTQKRIDLDKNKVENRPSNRVNNKGILITSDEDITVYYEVANGVNPDKFTLKGHNGLGTEFYIPSQNTYRNKPHRQIADEKVDIVATENNTTITIVPTVAIVGHKANVPYTILLNKGQTYCIENQNDISPSSSLAGSYITSDKDIAITISDDSIWQGPRYGPYDLIGDQLIPTSVIGTKYIAINTSPDSRTINKVYVLATQDDTYVKVNYNSKNLFKKLSKGQQLELNIKGNALYIDADKPVYAYQLASLWNKDGNEMGSAILPSINCTGSKSVSFVRTFTLDFWVQILTQKMNLSSFIFKDQNGNMRNDLDHIKWEKVVGTDKGSVGQTWYSGVIKLDITTGSPHTIENTTGLFHLSILDENQGSTSYGYFSSYGQLRLEGPTQECKGNRIILRTTEPMKSYNWFSEHTGQVIQSTNPTFEVSQSGTYWVEAEVDFGGCIQTDSINVEFIFPEFDLGEDEVVCPDESIRFEVPGNLGTYEWFNGTNGNSTSLTLNEGDSQDVWLKVTDEFNCSNTERKQVSTHVLPIITLDKTEICEGESIIADKTGIEQFEWSFNEVILNTDPTQNFIKPQKSGIYSLKVWNAEGCVKTQDFSITVNSLPIFDIPDQLGCIAAITTISAPLKGNGYSYLWSDSSNGVDLELKTVGNYWLEIKDNNGCTTRDEFNFDFLAPKPFDLGPDREECVGVTLTINQGSDYTNYEWNFQQDGVGPINPLKTPTPEYQYKISSAAPDNSGRYYVTAIDKDGCAVADDVEVSFVDAPELYDLNVDLCDGKHLDIEVAEGYTDGYVWYFNGVLDNSIIGNEITVSKPGVYRVEATIGGCTKMSEISVIGRSNPSISLNAPANICPEAKDVISVNYFKEGNGTFDYLIWNDAQRQFTDWTTATLEIEKAGTFNVTAYDEYGCSAVDNVVVNEYNSTAINMIDQMETCENIALTLTNPISSAKSYDWYKVNTGEDKLLISNADWNTNEAGSYRLLIEDINGCKSEDTVVIISLPVPEVNLGADREMCEGDILTLINDVSDVSYRWNKNDNLNESSLIVSSTNNYRLEVTNMHGCVAEDEVLITAHPLPNIVVDDVIECSGELGTLSAPAGLTNFEWSNGETTPYITVTKGVYTLSAETDKGCKGKAVARVKWHPIPNVSIGADTSICPIDVILLEATPGFASYEWHNGDSNPTTYANLSDTVNLVTVTDHNGCVGFDTRMIYALPVPDYELCPDTAICVGDSLLLEAGYDHVMYEWFDKSSLPTYMVKETGDYWVKVLDGCFWLSDTARIEFNENPIIAQIDTLIYGQIGVLAEGGAEPYEYAINDKDWQEENIFKKLENGTYIIQVRDFNTCMASDTIIFSSIFDIDIPNFFTPNRDGFNDRWEIEGINKFPNSIIKIFDRYGKLLIEYKATDPGWNGDYIGKPAPSDAYWYVIEILPLKKYFKGHITLKR